MAWATGCRGVEFLYDPAMPTRLAVLFVATVAFAPGLHAQSEEAKVYQECVEAATGRSGDAAKALEVCLAPANAGIPGAQYAMGALLVQRNQPGDRAAGIEWLEKAVAANNPAAAFTLAGVLLEEQDKPASQTRGRDLLKSTICAGYPKAVEVVEQQGFKRENVGCESKPAEDFTGEWIADLKYAKADAVLANAPPFQLKLVLAPGSAHVFRKQDQAWTEIKPNSFKLQILEQSASITSLDSGWDFDGEWIEAWTLNLLRVGAAEARVSFLRTVNNPHVPSTISWRTFSTLSEGTARRSPK